MNANTRRKSSILYASLLALLLGFGSSASNAYHDTLTVFVNGQQLTPDEIHYVEQVTGVRIRSGFYWYDAASGYWGVVNGPVVGRVAPQGGQGGSDVWSQGSTVTEAYPNGGAASRNPNVGIGVITDGQGGAFITN
jgi:hypothetical protein